MKNSSMVKSFILGLVIVFITGITQAASPSIMLTGVMQSQDGPAAYIEGKLLHIGDEVAGYNITSIRHVGIEIEDAKGKKAYFVPVANPAGIREIDVQPEVVPEVVPEERVEIQETAEPEGADEWQAGVSVMSTEPEEPATESKSSPAFSFDMEDSMLIGAVVLIGLGFLISFIANIWYLVACFMESIWWGLGALFIPFVELIFLFMHWERAKKPFLLGIVGVLMIAASAFLSPDLLLSFYDY